MIMNLPAWLHHLFNPHCVECAHDELEKHICQSCEILKQQLAIANDEKRHLLNKLINPTELVEAEKEPPVLLKPRHIPWKVKQQILEAEDRKAAELKREKQKEINNMNSIKPINNTNEDVAELEKELDIVSSAREVERGPSGGVAFRDNSFKDVN